MIEAELQLVTVILWLALLKLLQLAIYPLLRETLEDIAYPLSYPVSLLFFTFITWYCGFFRLPVALATVCFIGLFCFMVLKKQYNLSLFRQQIGWDIAFLAGFLYLLLIRFYNPAISFAEKFMDHAFLASVMRNPVVPPLDPWFAGSDLSIYYYLGHWMSGAPGHVIGADSFLVFNLMLPTVAGMAVVAAVAFGYLLLPRYRWLPALILLIPNPAVVWHLLTGTDVASIPWESTRVIAGTINEYPIFSFFWGDPHAHILGIFNQILFLTLAAVLLLRYGDLALRSRLLLAALLALSLGTMPGLHSWDVLLYAPLYCVIALWTGIRHAMRDPVEWMPLLIVPPLSLLLYGPLLLSIEGAGILGIGIVPEGSSLVSFLLVHGFFLAVFFAYGADQLYRRPWLLAILLAAYFFGYLAAGAALLALILICLKRLGRPEDIIAIAGLATIIACELIFLQDGMGDVFFRMNTVFKLYIGAWVMMGLAALVIAGKWLSAAKWPYKIPEIVKLGAAVLVVTVLLLLPSSVPLTYGYGSGTLDGAAWLFDRHPGDAAAISYLRSLDGDLVVVEAVGEGYTYAARISSFTGIPTILGWPGHELVWRGDEDGWYHKRIQDVRIIYETPDQSPILLQEYGVTHIVVGSFEKERYLVNLPSEGLKPVFSEGGTTIYEVLHPVPEKNLYPPSL